MRKKVVGLLMIVAFMLLSACSNTASNDARSGDSGQAGASTNAEDSVADFYRGKTLKIVVGTDEGGGYDLYARLLAPHIGKHIPGNPRVIVENMPGARGMVAANYIYNVGPKDGSEIVVIHRALYKEQMLQSDGVQFDLLKMNWIGSTNQEVSTCMARKDAGIRKFEDLFEKPLIVGATIPGEERFFNETLGTKFEIISGYAGGNDVMLAIERGEVDGRCNWSVSSIEGYGKERVDAGDYILLSQNGLNRHPNLPNKIPLILDFVKDEETKALFELFFGEMKIGRPFLAPQDVPTERIQALRKAFIDTMSDPDFLADAQAQQLEINPVSGEELQDLVKRLFDSPPELIQKLDEIMN